MHVELELNGEDRRFEAAKSDSLLDVLRANGYTGAKRGCDTGACGFCTVIVDGEARNSCVLPAARVHGASVETIEGLGEQADLHPIQAAFVDNSALQCGFCIPGMIMRSKALLAENPDPSEQAVREGIEDNLCRCTGYKKIVESVQDAADRMDGADGDGPSGYPGDGADEEGLATDGGCMTDGSGGAACDCLDGGEPE